MSSITSYCARIPLRGSLGGRDFITVLVGTTAWVAAARGEEPRHVIGYLSGFSSREGDPGALAAFYQGLKETGFVEGKNIKIEFRLADGHYDRLPSLAAELVSHNVAVIVAFSVPLAFAAKAATKTIPIIFAVGADPVKLGLVESLSRPNSNLTGVSTESELEAVFATMVQHRVGALIVMADPFLIDRREQLVELAARHTMPTIYPGREFADLGGLMSYGSNVLDLDRQAGIYIGKILKGAKAADLPIQQSTKVELVINLKIAKALNTPLYPSRAANEGASPLTARPDGRCSRCHRNAVKRLARASI